MYKPTEENEWMYKIAQGMALIKEGCAMNEYWSDCDYCPFDEYCSAIMDKHCKFGDSMEDAMKKALEEFNKKIFAET